nr:gamma carbonic anhydrase family protein [uncultured Microbacterium sp.]
MFIASGASVIALEGRVPSIASDVFVADGARIVGDVALMPGASVWCNAVLRADSATITIGPGSNVQDNVSVHVDADNPAVIGSDVSIGHNAVVHGCTIGDGSLIGMGAVVLSGAVIGAGCLVAGGAVVLGGSRIPDGSLVAGVPAQVRRPLSAEERARLLDNAAIYRAHVTTHSTATPGGPRDFR